MGNSFGNTLASSANVNTEEKMKENNEKYIRQRAQECIAIDKAELSKRAMDAGAKARTAINQIIAKLEAEVNTYLNANMSTIISNKYEILHISELEAKADTAGYRNGKIIAEIQRIIVFKRS